MRAVLHRPNPRPAQSAALPLGILLGAALQLQQPELSPASSYLAFSSAALVLCAMARAARTRFARGWVVALLTIVAAGALAFGATGLRAVVQSQDALDAALEGVDLELTGTVAAMPQRSELGLRFRFDVETAQLQGAPVRVPPRLLLSWYTALPQSQRQPPDSSLGAAEVVHPELHAGERWHFTARIKSPHGNVNPHGFDYELWLWEQGIGATGYLRTGRGDPAPRRLDDSLWRHPVERARESVRDAIFARVTDAKSAGILAALVTGDQAAIERGDWDVFRATGVAHLMSISGLHITMFAWLAAMVVGALWRRSARLCLAFAAPHAALVGGVLLAGGYALFSGWGIPAQRTVLMLGVAALLRVSGRRWPWPQVWLATCAVVVAIDPWALTQAGFWLSFVAVGILFATDRGAEDAIQTSDGGRFGFRNVGRSLYAAARTQALITLALAPLTLLLFNRVSLVGLPANAIAIPWITLVVTPLALGGVLLPPLWDLAAVAVHALGFALERLAALPFSTLSLASADLVTSAAALLGAALLALRLPWGLRLLGLPLVLPLLLWQAPRPAAGEFDLLAADVGQGNAVLLRTANHALLYDAGPRFSGDSDAGNRVLVPLLRALGERVDLLLLSHSDSDHTGGGRAVLAMQPHAALLSSLASDHPLQSMRDEQRRCEAGQRWPWDGVEFEILHPRADDYDIARTKPNALSCVLRISNGRRSALLAGDIEARQEARLVADGIAPADLLLVPHHGSKTSSSDDFLAAVKPRIAWVQAGWRNRFGHPAPPVVARYQAHGIALWDSAHCGAARWRSVAPQNVDCERARTRRYWRHPLPPAD